MKIDGSDFNQKKQQGKPENLNQWLMKNKSTLEGVIPKGTLNLDRFMQSALLEIMNPKNPLLARCNPLSILRSLKEAASLGLEVGGVLGQAYLIPYNEKVNGEKVMTCHFQMGYKGIIALARRSNTIKTIACEVVYENDHFEVEYGVGRTLKHKRDFTKQRGKPIAYYCLVELVNGGIQFDVESVEDIITHRDKFSKAYDPNDSNNVWNKNFNEMSLKTCCIRALKLCPISIEALEAVRKDELSDIEPEMRNVTPDFNMDDSIPAEIAEPWQFQQIEQQTSFNSTIQQPEQTYEPTDAELEAELNGGYANQQIPDELF